MIAKHYGRTYTLQTLREKFFITRQGVSMLGISDAAESIGFHTTGVRINFDQLVNDVPLPCILHWNQNHFVVLYKISRSSKHPLPKGGGWGWAVLNPVLSKKNLPPTNKQRLYFF
jgi:ATP-binding cassette subfamily B protein